MKPKTKAFLFNFLSFGVIFVILRFGINFLLPETNYFLALMLSGILAIFFSPQFAAIPTEEGEKLFVKWFFWKGVKKIGK